MKHKHSRNGNGKVISHDNLNVGFVESRKILNKIVYGIGADAIDSYDFALGVRAVQAMLKGWFAVPAMYSAYPRAFDTDIGKIVTDDTDTAAMGIFNKTTFDTLFSHEHEDGILANLLRGVRSIEAVTVTQGVVVFRVNAKMSRRFKRGSAVSYLSKLKFNNFTEFHMSAIASYLSELVRASTGYPIMSSCSGNRIRIQFDWFQLQAALDAGNTLPMVSKGERTAVKRAAWAWLTKAWGYPESEPAVVDLDSLDAVAKLDAEYAEQVSDAVDMLIDEASGFLDHVDDEDDDAEEEEREDESEVEGAEEEAEGLT